VSTSLGPLQFDWRQDVIHLRSICAAAYRQTSLVRDIYSFSHGNGKTIQDQRSAIKASQTPTRLNKHSRLP
jgi:hypothetical protein